MREQRVAEPGDETSPDIAPGTAPDIARWLTARLAALLGQPAEQIRPESRLADLGLDSVYGFTLCGDIEDAFGVDLEPEQIWNIDTLTALTAFLAAAAAGNPPPNQQ